MESTFGSAIVTVWLCAISVFLGACREPNEPPRHPSNPLPDDPKNPVALLVRRPTASVPLVTTPARVEKASIRTAKK